MKPILFVIVISTCFGCMPVGTSGSGSLGDGPDDDVTGANTGGANTDLCDGIQDGAGRCYPFCSSDRECDTPSGLTCQPAPLRDGTIVNICRPSTSGISGSGANPAPAPAQATPEATSTEPSAPAAAPLAGIPTPDSNCGTVHTVTTTDETSDFEAYMDFAPAELTIAVGDCVNFEMSSTHNAVEVSQETYDTKGRTPLDGGFNIDFGETAQVQFNETGIYYYICVPHVSGDMVGTITVQ